MRKMLINFISSFSHLIAWFKTSKSNINMQFTMSRMRHDYKIRNIIIKFISIYMMNMFVSFKNTTKKLAHNISMLTNIFSMTFTRRNPYSFISSAGIYMCSAFPSRMIFSIHAIWISIFPPRLRSFSHSLSIYFLLFIANIFIVTPSYASKDYCKRFPTDTAMECYTPNNPPATSATNVGIGTTGRYIIYTGTATAGPSASMFENSVGNIGIGTTTPQGALTVINGNVGIGTWAPGGALSVMGGNVGIGVNAPTNALNVVTSTANAVGTTLTNTSGAGWSGLALSTGGTLAYGGAAANAPFDSRVALNMANGVPFAIGYNGTRTHNFYSSGNVGINNLSAADPGVTLYVSGTASITGNVGIGTTTPQAAFVVTNGNVGIGTWTAANALDVKGAINASSTATATQFIAGNGSLASPAFRGTDNDTGMNFGTGALGNDIIFDVNNANRFIITNAALLTDGVMGWMASLSESSPDTGLSRLSAGVLALGTGAASSTAGTLIASNIGLGTTTPQGAFVVTNGNVGIGTWAPASLLQVGANTTTAAGGMMFGTDTNLYRSGTGALSVTGSSLGGFAFQGGPQVMGDATTLYLAGQNGILFRIGNNAVGAGTTRFQLSSAGVATFSPDATTALTITGSSGAATLTGGAGNMTITAGTGNSRTLALQTTTSGGTATTALTLNADQSATFTGNVGIGTTTPQAAFVVTNGNVGIGTWTATQTLDVKGSLNVGTSTDVGSINLGGDQVLNSTLSPLTLTLNGAGFTNTVINNGNVGIGTTTPGIKFYVKGNTTMGGSLGIGGDPTGLGYGLYVYSAANNANQILAIAGKYAYLEAASGTNLFDIGVNGTGANHLVTGSKDNAGILSAYNTNPIQFASADSVKMTILTGGNVGIGTVDPTALLEVKGDTKVFDGVYLSKQTTPPSIANNDCGSLTQGVMVTSPSSRDEAGSVTTGTSAGATAACKITFGQSHTSAPAWCACDDNTTPLVLQPTMTNVALTCTAPATLASSTVSYACKWTDK